MTEQSANAAASTAGPAEADPTAVHRTLDELRAAHREARQRRDRAVLGTDEHRAAVLEVGRLEVEMARIQRGTTPPLV
jgi:hypothetical protein